MAQLSCRHISISYCNCDNQVWKYIIATESYISSITLDYSKNKVACRSLNLSLLRVPQSPHTPTSQALRGSLILEDQAFSSPSSSINDVIVKVSDTYGENKTVFFCISLICARVRCRMFISEPLLSRPKYFILI